MYDSSSNLGGSVIENVRGYLPKCPWCKRCKTNIPSTLTYGPLANEFLLPMLSIPMAPAPSPCPPLDSNCDASKASGNVESISSVNRTRKTLDLTKVTIYSVVLWRWEKDKPRSDTRAQVLAAKMAKFVLARQLEMECPSSRRQLRSLFAKWQG